MDYGLGYYGAGCSTNNFGPSGKCYTPGGPFFSQFMIGSNIAFLPTNPMERKNARLIRSKLANNSNRPRPPRLDCNNPDTVGVL